MNVTKFACENGIQSWRNDERQYHRLDGPALIWKDGDQWWFKNGLRHRLDGPAYISFNGSEKWWINGERHRENGPALIHPDGRKKWFFHGKIHREDGPAIIWNDGREEWHIEDKNITQELCLWIAENELLPWTEWTSEDWVLFNLAFR